MNNADELRAFEAGWHARREVEDHEWDPSPPDTPKKAYERWKLTCAQGHIIRVLGCAGCDVLRKAGVRGIYNGEYDEN